MNRQRKEFGKGPEEKLKALKARSLIFAAHKGSTRRQPKLRTRRKVNTGGR